MRKHGLMMYLAAINLVASVYDAAFPAMMLSREGGSAQVLGMVNAVIGVPTLFGTLGIAGVMVCLYFQKNRYIRELKAQEMQSTD